MICLGPYHAFKFFLTHRRKRTVGEQVDEFPSSDVELSSLPVTKLVPYDAHVHPDFPAEAPIARGLYNIPLGHNLDKAVDEEFRAGYRRVVVNGHPKEHSTLVSERLDTSILVEHKASQRNSHSFEMGEIILQ
uniref:Uncharacterized protein n=1 Tax=Ditylenchus dipsaci TaxID=166011 RepID=A0A915DXX0_9BILA